MRHTNARIRAWRVTIVAALACATVVSLAACVYDMPARPAAANARSAPADASPSASASASVATVRMVILGDSNSATTTIPGLRKWPVLLRDELASAYPSITYTLADNAVPGRTSGEVWTHLAADSLDLHPDIVCLMVGTNDVLGADNPERACPLSATEANLRAIITQTLAASSTVTSGGHPLVVLMQPLPACSKTTFAAHLTSYPFYRARSSAEDASNNLLGVKALVSRLAVEYDLPVVDTYDLTAALGYDGTQPATSTLFSDGLHATEREHANIARWTYEAIAPRVFGSGVP